MRERLKRIGRVLFPEPKRRPSLTPKNLELIGSAAFFTVTLSLVYHLLSMSFYSMLQNTCVNCNASDPLASWHTSLRERCYEAPMKSLVAILNLTVNGTVPDSYTTSVCVPNQYLMAKSSQYAYNCLLVNLDRAHTVCSTGDYDPSQCKCAYSSATKAATAFSVLTALILGVMFFLSQLLSSVKKDYALRWLIPLCFSLLGTAAFFIIITMSIISANKNQDIDELIYSSSLFKAAIKNKTLIEAWQQTIKTNSKVSYTVTLSWCFGMELLAFHAVLVAIIFLAIKFPPNLRPAPPRPKT